MLESFIRKKYRHTDGSGAAHELVLHPQHMDDLMLWRSFRSGDEKALIIIFDKFTKALYGYGYKIVGDRELVKDEVQDLFIELWQNRERLGDTDSIKFYLFKSLRRKLLRSTSKSEHRLFGRFLISDNKDVAHSHEFILISEQTCQERRQKLMLMLSKLTKRQHEAIFLRYFEELNCDQIAAVMDLSKQAVYNLIHHAINQLKKCIDKGSSF